MPVPFPCPNMVDGSGTTQYSYNPVNGALGAGRLASVTSPIMGTGSTAVVTYSYDELGRVVTRGVDQATTNANNVSTTFDALGRVTHVSNALGAFVYGYVDQTSRLQTVTDPVGTGGTGLSLNTTYSYFNNTGDQRLQEIKNLKGTTPVSDFQYTYNPVGTIATWQLQADSSTPTAYTLGYDNADELTSAVQKNTNTQAAVSNNGYDYDPAGNRLLDTTLTVTRAGKFNALNQLTGITGSPTTRTVAGFTSAATSSVTVDGLSATISNSTNFLASVPMPSGTNVMSVVAQPSATGGATTTQRYGIVNSGGAATQLSYDANGNCTQDESGNHYTWDALNRLTKITYTSTAYTAFAYDGLSRRIQIAEYNSSQTLTSTKNYLWIGSEIAEERNASNAVQKRFFPQGEQQSGTNYYYTRDHLGSVREMLNSSGGIVARYSYDPYGRTTLVSGTNLATKQYAGMYMHQPSGLYFTKYRAFDSSTGRWLSRDPIAERGGINLYEYCGDDSIDYLDPSGQFSIGPKKAASIVVTQVAGGGPEDPIPDLIDIIIILWPDPQTPPTPPSPVPHSPAPSPRTTPKPVPPPPAPRCQPYAPVPPQRMPPPRLPQRVCVYNCSDGSQEGFIATICPGDTPKPGKPGVTCVLVDSWWAP